MDTNKIKAVLRAAELNSFSKAAEELSYTPSAFSHIADSLEDELGVVLLKRTSAGVEWTDVGKKLLPEFDSLISQEEKIIKKAEALSCDEKTLTLGTYASISRTFLPKTIKEIRANLKGIRLNIVVGDNINALLKKDKADMIITEVVPDGKEYVYKEIYKEDYSAVLPLGVKSTGAPTTKEFLYKFPFIMCSESILKSYFDLSKFKEVIHVVSDDDASVIKMVKEGIGITVLPKLSLSGATSEVNVCKLQEKLTRTLGIAYKKNNPKKKEIKKLASFFYVEKDDAAQIERV